MDDKIILHLTLKKKWFDMILSGIKKEEYREIKPYWIKRLVANPLLSGIVYKRFTHVTFKNGYNKNSREILVEVEDIRTSKGRIEWGATEGVKCFVIELGKIVQTKNM